MKNITQKQLKDLLSKKIRILQINSDKDGVYVDIDFKYFTKALIEEYDYTKEEAVNVTLLIKSEARKNWDEQNKGILKWVLNLK